ncbi:unnamed protein product [Allacma fusca]|uniref:Kazal-like domain-containing protein n=1 Tax=Allacma fusca TaxID=39272 RepID=A0A8J2KMZ7_9HEXA|nr:unnamed protein product [Allacma fusca]
MKLSIFFTVFAILVVSFAAAQRFKPQPNGCRGGQPSCICTMEYSPVCGSNGVTYSNRCGLLCAQKCDRSLRIAYRGKCGGRAVNEPQHFHDKILKLEVPQSQCRTTGVGVAFHVNKESHPGVSARVSINLFVARTDEPTATCVKLNVLNDATAISNMLTVARVPVGASQSPTVQHSSFTTLLNRCHDEMFWSHIGNIFQVFT